MELQMGRGVYRPDRSRHKIERFDLRGQGQKSEEYDGKHFRLNNFHWNSSKLSFRIRNSLISLEITPAPLGPINHNCAREPHH